MIFTSLIWRGVGAGAMLMVAACVSNHFPDAYRPSGDPDLRALCEASSVAPRVPLSEDSRPDSAISERFSAVCHVLARQDGFDFGQDAMAYACDIHLPRNEASADAVRKYAAIEHAFEKRITLSSFPTLMAEPDDIREDTLARRDPAQVLEPEMPLAPRSGFPGLGITVLIVARPDGSPSRVILTRRELRSSLRGVRNLRGAIELVELIRPTGLPVQNPAGQWITRLCTARHVRADAEGWTLVNVSVQPNCRPTLVRDYRIEKTGKITVLKEREPLAGSMICGD